MLAGVAVLAVVGLGSGIAHAQDGDNSPPLPPAHSADVGPDRGPAPWQHHRQSPGRIEHGEFTVRTDTGHQVVKVQHGTVTAVDGHSLTVKSADGFSGTYTIDEQTKVGKDRQSATVDQVSVDDRVIVFADGATSVAKRIGDLGPGK